MDGSKEIVSVAMSFPNHAVMKVAAAKPVGATPRLNIPDWTHCVISGIRGLVSLYSLIGMLILLPVCAAAQDADQEGLNPLWIRPKLSWLLDNNQKDCVNLAGWLAISRRGTLRTSRRSGRAPCVTG